MMHTQYRMREKNALTRMSVFIFSILIGIITLSVAKWVYEPGEEYVFAMNEELQASAGTSLEPIVFDDSKVKAEGKTVDPRNTSTFNKKVEEVRNFMEKRNAPLKANAEDFVRAAEIYKIDYRLLPAISIVESSGGRRLFRQYNPFGWGKSGYPSFKAAIYDVSRGMSRYYAAGLKTPSAIGKRYNPVTPKQWASKVQGLMNQMSAL